jgi:hypothetical protein
VEPIPTIARNPYPRLPGGTVGYQMESLMVIEMIH